MCINNLTNFVHIPESHYRLVTSSLKYVSTVISGLLTLFLCSLARNPINPTAPMIAKISRIISRQDMMWMEHPGQEQCRCVAWLRVEEVRV